MTLSTPNSASHSMATRRGTHVCVNCGFALPAELDDELPDCPNCGATEFRAAGMFAPRAMSPRYDLRVERDRNVELDWVVEARESLAPGSTPCLTFRDEEIVHVFSLQEPLTRIGRSPVAHVLLDDPTVSRRHAMIAREGGRLRLFDDRSLNGVYVNGERVEQSDLVDGDEVVIGSVRLYVVAP